MIRLLMRWCLPDKAFRWSRPALLPAYVDMILRREYLPAIRSALDEPSPLWRLTQP